MMLDEAGFDFGDFQTAEEGAEVEVDIDERDDGDGQLTPTAGSWTFEDDFGFGPPTSNEKNKGDRNLKDGS